MNLNKRLVVAALTVATFVLGAGCVPQLPGAPAAPKGPAGELRVAMFDLGGERTDPSQGTITLLTNYTSPMYESLIDVKTDDGTPAPGLAERWELAADGKAWTFYLRKGVKFHNGEEMTGEDVKFSIETWASEHSKSAQAALWKKKTKSLEVVDPHTVRLNLTEPWPVMPWIGSRRSGIETTVLPKRYREAVGSWEALENKPIGTGPWKFIKRELGSYIEYEANTDYWGQVPRFAKLRISLVPEEGTRVTMLKTGEADIARISPDSIEEVRKAGLEVAVAPLAIGMRLHFYGSNLKEAGPLYDLKVRKALNLAINREELAKSLYPGLSTPMAWFTSGPKDLGMPQDLKPYPYDLTQAKALLTEAGYPAGFSFEFFQMTGLGPLPADESRRLAEAVAGYWEKIGVKAKIIPTDIAWLRPRYRADPQPPEIIGRVSNWGVSVYAPVVRDLGVYMKWKGGTVRLANNLDDIILKAEAGATEEEVKRYSEEAVRQAYAEYRGAPLFYVSAPHGVGKRIKELRLSAGFESLLTYIHYATPR